jgi:hypothetical protein
MVSRDFVLSHPDRPVRRPIFTRHPLWLSAALAAVAGLAALFAESVPQESVPQPPRAATPAATEQFEYFPELYESQAKQVEEPVATF